MHLSEHFTRAEAEHSEVAMRRGIDNTLPDRLLENAKKVAELVLEPTRAFFNTPIRPNSWYRSQALNDAIGGSQNSAHMNGLAVDIELPGTNNWELLHMFSRHEIYFDQVIAEFMEVGNATKGWVHVAMAGPGQMPRQQILFFPGSGYQVISRPWIEKRLGV